VKDIVEGQVDVDEFDKKLQEEEKLNKIKEELKEKDKEERLKKGRPGKGNQKGYVKFCRYCFTEFLIDIDKCTHCGKETITQEVSFCLSSR
jgi:hypothetical protein